MLLSQPSAVEGVVCFHPGRSAPRAGDNTKVRVDSDDVFDNGDQAFLFSVDGKHPEGWVRVVTVRVAAGVVEVRCAHTNANHGKAGSGCRAEQCAQCLIPRGVRHTFLQEECG